MDKKIKLQHKLDELEFIFTKLRKDINFKIYDDKTHAHFKELILKGQDLILDLKKINND